MRCKIADLLVEIPEAGGMSARCRDYIATDAGEPDIVLKEEYYDLEKWSKLSYENAIYMETGNIFYSWLLRNDGIMLHSSAIEYNGKAYLFSGPSGMGKSTHTRLWRQTFGDAVKVFNDDKPALRQIDGIWYAYGTPWCGKDGININTKVPLAGICFLRRGDANTIRRLPPLQASSAIISQTIRRFNSEKGLAVMLGTVDKLVEKIPVYELACLPDEAAARLSHDTMTRKTEEENK